MRNFLIFFLIPVVLLAGADCSQAARRDPEPATYLFCAPPYQQGQTMENVRAWYLQLVTWLGKKSGCRFNVVGSASYDESVDLLINGKVQIALLGPASYVVAKQKNADIVLLGTQLIWNAGKTRLIDSYHSNIISLKSRKDIRQIKDLEGKKFAFVDKISTSGFVYPNDVLRRQGIVPEEHFAKIYYLGTHPRVTEAIVEGSIDAGATWDFNLWDGEKKYGKVFNNLLQSEPIPNSALAAHPSLPAGIRGKITKSLPVIDPAVLKGLPSAGYTIRPDGFYDGVRKLMEQNQP